jgi:hypothetical protein
MEGNAAAAVSYDMDLEGFVPNFGDTVRISNVLKEFTWKKS